VFDFGHGFTLDFGEFEATIKSVEVRASGQELTVVTSPKQFLYNATLSAGWNGSRHGKILANATLEFENGGIEEDVTLVFKFGFANLFEQFDLKKKDMPADCEDLLDVTVPKKEDLFFEVTNGQLIGPRWLVNCPNMPSMNLVVIIDNGKPPLVETFEFINP
jgi:hypothetical protein